MKIIKFEYSLHLLCVSFVLLSSLLLGGCTDELSDALRKNKSLENNTPIDVDILKYGAIGDASTDCSAAFVAAITELKKTGGTLYLPAGKFKLNSAVVSIIELPVSIRIIGAGIGVTEIHVYNSTGAFLFTFNSDISKLEIADMTFRASAADCGVAIKTQYPLTLTSNTTNLTIRNVEMRILGENNVAANLFFNRYVYVEGAYKPIFDNIVISAAFGPNVQSDLWQHPELLGIVGIEASNTYAPQFRDCYVWNNTTGYKISNYPNIGTDSIVFQRSYGVGLRTGIDISNVKTSPVLIEDGHYNNLEYGIKLKAVNNAIIRTNLMYNVQPVDRPDYIDILVDSCKNVKIQDNIFYFANVVPRVGVYIQNKSDMISVNRNRFALTGTSIVNTTNCTNLNLTKNSYDVYATQPEVR